MSIRVFLAEDDAAIRSMIETNLRYTGYCVQAFADGAEAAAYLLHDHAFDIAVLDIMLPGMDGFALLESVRAHAIPAIFLTAKADIGSKLKGLRGGAEDYITKPFEVLELLVRMEKILARTGKEERELCFQDICLCAKDRVAVQAGKPVELTPLEFDLLAMLIRYKNRTLLRERLLNEIWGIDFAGGTRTVDVHIAQLRKKLRLSAYIKTIPKYGYRLEDDPS